MNRTFRLPIHRDFGKPLVFAGLWIGVLCTLSSILGSGDATRAGPELANMVAIVDFMANPQVWAVIMLAGVLIALFGADGAPIHIAALPDPIGEQPTYTRTDLEADASEALDALMDRLDTLKAMPDSVVPGETRVEAHAIRARHLPGLLDAHKAARRGTKARSTAAKALDTDLAGSLWQMSDKVEGWIDLCNKTAIDQFDTHRRFVAARHDHA